MIEGTWIPTSAELGGNPFPQEILTSMKLIIKEGKYTALVGEAVDAGTLRLHDSAKPAEMDILGVEGPNKGRTILAIYEHTGDTLKICYDLSGSARPQEFTTKGNAQRFLVSYGRAGG